MKAGKYIVGIDLGTTNSVLAYCLQTTAKNQARTRQIKLFEVDQLVASGEVSALPLLPSIRYHAQEGELAQHDLALPWQSGDASAPVFGRYARQLGSQVPGRLVTSAKSWLSHTAVDRTAAILPWGAPPEVAKVSPLTASSSYLSYLKASWEQQFPNDPLDQQELILTVPASFDEAARALTIEAAQLAGLPKLRLVEEPQAAFYDWIYRHQAKLADSLAGCELVLVCDVGGGTTDFSLIAVHAAEVDGTDASQPDATPTLTRIGVGNHLMLGGDNMDLALAHLVERRLQQDATEPSKLSSVRLAQLMERCRAAKEVLLANDAPSSSKVTLLGSGAKLIGASRSVEITQDDIRSILLDGFFPECASNTIPKRSRSGMLEFGLPYASDAGITRHLAQFLQQHQGAIAHALQRSSTDGMLLPDSLLLNGGVFRAPALVERLCQVLTQWRGAPLRVLHNDNPDVAVARGAVAFALAKQGRAPSIAGGSPRSYFLVVDSGVKNEVQQTAICILPRGTQTGIEQRLQEHSFALRLGQPVRFHLVSSIAQEATLGEILTLDSFDFIPLPPLATVLQTPENWPHARQEIPVQLLSCVSELGTLEIHCVAGPEFKEQRWLLPFQLRSAEQIDAPSDSQQISNNDALPSNFAQALAKIDRIFGNRAQQVSAKEVKQLRGQLEAELGSREKWNTTVLRALFDALWQRQKGRRRSAEHEQQWLNMIGYCLRPGFGDALDSWRISQLWPLFEQGPQYKTDKQVAVQWWTLWRRVAGGLDAAGQLRLLDDFALNLQGSAEDLRQRPAHTMLGNYADMLRLGAALERIPAEYKVEIGDWLLKQLKPIDQLDKSEAAQQDIVLWALARVGAREPMYGNWEQVVGPEVVATWLHDLLARDWRKQEACAFAASHLARMTGERSRELDDETRKQVLAKLAACGAPANWQSMVREVVVLDEAAQARLIGESLPPGLKLLHSAKPS